MQENTLAEKGTEEKTLPIPYDKAEKIQYREN